mgnify:CR=1 FL=1
MGKIPVITDTRQLIRQIQGWQRGMKEVVKRVPEPEVPWNFSAVSKQGGNQLSWAVVDSADGYVIDWNLTGDFETGFTSISIGDSGAADYFDTVATQGGTAPAKRYYRLYATAGTALQPHSVKGNFTAVISATAIAPNDTATASVTTQDNSTNDNSQKWDSGRYLEF